MNARVPAAAISALALLASLSQAAVIFQDDFESDALDSSPAGWSINNSPTTFLVKTEAQSPIGDLGDDRGMRLDNDPGATFENMQRGFAAQTGTFYLQFDYYAFNLAELHNLQIGDDSVAGSNRGINLTMSTASGVAVDSWYRFTLTINVAADDYDLRLQSLDDTSLDTTTTGIGFQNAQAELDIIRFWFNTSNQGAGDFALDNILTTDDSNDLNFTVIPEPSSLALSLIGLLGLWKRRRVY